MQQGSPPLMRGKPIFALIFAIRFRITPAHAGKTLCLRPVRWKPEDHPRSCGENIIADSLERIYRGSPPLMRGKPTYSCV